MNYKRQKNAEKKQRLQKKNNQSRNQKKRQTKKVQLDFIKNADIFWNKFIFYFLGIYKKMYDYEEGEYLRFKIEQTLRNVVKLKEDNNKKYTHKRLNTQGLSRVDYDIYATPKKTNFKKQTNQNQKMNSPKEAKSTKSSSRIISFSKTATKKQEQTKQIFQVSGQQKIIKSKSNFQGVKKLLNFDKSQDKNIKKNDNKQNLNQYFSSYPNSPLVGNLQNQQLKKSYLSLLKKVQLYEDKITRLEQQLKIKNKNIEQFLSQKKRTDNEKLHVGNSLTERGYKQFQCQRYQQSLRRLLEMLKMTNQYKQFAEISLNNDNGITFLTEVSIKSGIKQFSQNQHREKLRKNKRLRQCHQCRCGDKFDQQMNLWVPSQIYEFGKQFIKQKTNPTQSTSQLSISQYELFLYELNRLWRQRQKKIINSLTHKKNLQIQKLKRKYCQSPINNSNLSLSKHNNKHY